MINFVLRCTGTTAQVDTHDIEDVDNAPSRVGDLQDEYQAQGITEYPIISRAKEYTAFRTVMTDFFDSFTRTLHSSSVLYTNEALFENLQAWLAPMTSAPIRPFRHTTTVISLTIVTAFCEIAEELNSVISTTRKQLEAEKKKKTVNRGRITELQTKIKEGERRLETVNRFIADSHDVVFVHRYRDVDPKIRADCMVALGGWITSYRAMFFEGQYLRYLGWVLSDTVAHTRAEVIKQLHKLFKNKDNIPNLSGFTDRFRPRLVEMAARDAEPGVRAATIELLDLMRDAELLEPSDIDTVGRLIFDAEPRVRKAVAKFFVSDINEAFTEQIEDIEELDDLFPNEEDDDFKEPRLAWIKFKILADKFQAYDQVENEEEAETLKARLRSITAAPGLESRYVLATQVIYPHFAELSEWEALAGYLAYDHSQIEEPSDDEDVAAKVQAMYKLDEGQEVILLGVLDCAVKLHLMNLAESTNDRKARKLKLTRDDAQESQELTAHKLAQTIPLLLSKFGAVPEAASAVLRLGHLLNLDLIEDLQQETTGFATFLDDVNKQFLSHSDQNVLAEASAALLNAKTSEELREATDGKLQELWDDSIENLQRYASSPDVDVRGKLDEDQLTELTNTVLRISNLSSIDNCALIFEKTATQNAKQKKNSKSASPRSALDILLDLAKHGIPSLDDIDVEVDGLEDELTSHVLKTLLFYFMWKINTLVTTLRAQPDTISAESIEDLARRRDEFAYTLTSIVQDRLGLDDLRLSATQTLLDLQTLFVTLRRVEPAPSANSSTTSELSSLVKGLIQEIPVETRNAIIKTHDLLERQLAKRLKRSIEIGDDEDPLDSDEEPEDDEEETEDDISTAQETLLIEKKLCELTGKIVLAIIGRVLDASGSDRGKIRTRLLRNKTKLGTNYKEVLSYLDDDLSSKAGAVTRAAVAQKSKPTTTAAAPNKNKIFKSTEHVIDDDDEDAIEDDDIARPTIEEDDEDDLRARGLVDDEIEDPVDEDEEGEKEQAADEDGDEIMGD